MPAFLELLKLGNYRRLKVCFQLCDFRSGVLCFQVLLNMHTSAQLGDTTLQYDNLTQSQTWTSWWAAEVFAAPAPALSPAWQVASKVSFLTCRHNMLASGTRVILRFQKCFWCCLSDAEIFHFFSNMGNISSLNIWEAPIYMKLTIISIVTGFHFLKNSKMEELSGIQFMLSMMIMMRIMVMTVMMMRVIWWS